MSCIISERRKDPGARHSPEGAQAPPLDTMSRRGMRWASGKSGEGTGGSTAPSGGAGSGSSAPCLCSYVPSSRTPTKQICRASKI